MNDYEDHLIRRNARANVQIATVAVILITSGLVPILAADSALVVASFPIARDGDLVVLPVQVGGEVHSFAFDTGCFGVMYDIKLKHILGDPKARSVFRTPGGPIDVEGFLAPQAHLGPIALPRDVLVWTHDFRWFREFSGHDVVGAIGIGALSRYIVQIDFDTGTLRFLSALGRDVGEPIPLIDQEGGVICVAARLPGARDARFAIDTGHRGCSGTISESIFSKLRDEGHLERLHFGNLAAGGGRVQVCTGALDEFRIGRRINHRGLDFSSVRGHNILGLEFLSRYVVTFDFPKRKMYLKPGKRYNVPVQRDMSGLTLARIDGQIVIRDVALDSPAYSLGLLKGDVLLHVGQGDAQDQRLFLVRRILSEQDTRQQLVLRRDRDTFTVELALHDWRDYDLKQRGKPRKRHP